MFNHLFHQPTIKFISICMIVILALAALPTSPVVPDFLGTLADGVEEYGAVDAAGDQAVVLALMVPAVVAMVVVVLAAMAVVPA